MEMRMIPQMFVVLGLAAGIATAQVAPPPPAEKPAEPEYNPTPPPQRTPQAARPQPQRPQDSGVQNLPTNVPYPKLAQRDEDGRVIRLKELPEILALRSNPTVGEKSVDQIMPVLYGRRARFEMLVVENLDLYWELTGGAIDNLDMSDLAAMSRVAEMIKPLVGKTSLSEELQNRGILSRTQGGMNEHIVREYKQSISEEIQAREGEDGIAEFMRFILNDSLHEAQIAYHGLLAEAKDKVGTLMTETGISNPQVAALEGPLSPIVDEAEQEIYALDDAMRTMSVDEAITFFTKLREMRENPNISPTVSRINVLHDRKVMYDGMKFKPLKEDEMPLGAGKVKKKEESAESDG